MTKFKRMEFHPNGDIELSAKIQRRLFELGCIWLSGDVKIKHAESLYLYVDDLGRITQTNYKQNNDHVPTTYEDILKIQEERRIQNERGYNLTYGQAVDALYLDPSKFFEVDCEKNLLGYSSENFCLSWFDKDTLKILGEVGTNASWKNAKLREYKPKPNMVTWYRPRVVWYGDQKRPTLHSLDYFHRSKKEWDFLGHAKILEWEEREFPETYAECDND